MDWTRINSRLYISAYNMFRGMKCQNVNRNLPTVDVQEFDAFRTDCSCFLAELTEQILS